MSHKNHRICFPNTQFPSLSLGQNTQLSEHLTVQNSPLLFGCRTGICGTCLVEVEGEITPPDREEREVLEILAPGNQKARLACQIQLTGDLEISVLTEKCDE